MPRVRQRTTKLRTSARAFAKLLTIQLCLLAATYPAAATAGVFAELHSAYELAKSIWRDLQQSQAHETGLPAGLHVYASQTSARVVRTSRGDAIVCHSGPCTWVVLFYICRTRARDRCSSIPQSSRSKYSTGDVTQ